MFLCSCFFPQHLACMKDNGNIQNLLGKKIIDKIGLEKFQEKEIKKSIYSICKIIFLATGKLNGRWGFVFFLKYVSQNHEPFYFILCYFLFLYVYIYIDNYSNFCLTKAYLSKKTFNYSLFLDYYKTQINRNIVGCSFGW